MLRGGAEAINKFGNLESETRGSKVDQMPRGEDTAQEAGQGFVSGSLRTITYTAEAGETPKEPSYERLPAERDQAAEGVRKTEEARASALMDRDCLRFLRVFSKDRYLTATELNERMTELNDWLKIALLVRADYLETLDSTVRITPSGQRAWEDFNKVMRLSQEGRKSRIDRR
jgi:hypothetical protein